MSLSSPLRIASRSLLSLTRPDWFALYLATASVALFALSLSISMPQNGHLAAQRPRWLGAGGLLTINRLLLIFLALEILLLAWLWLEFPRRRQAENALRRIHSLHRAIARSSARIVVMAPAEIAGGLQLELETIREVLGVDRISWYQQSPDGARFMRLQTGSIEANAPDSAFFTRVDHPWLMQAVLQGTPALVRSLKEMPAGSETDRANLEGAGVKSFGVVPSLGSGGGANALLLTSFTREIDWDEEVVAQLSVLASVFASAHARKLAQEAGTESELRFRRLFEEAPIGCCLVNREGRLCATNPAMTTMLGYSNGELTGKEFWEITAEDDVARSLVHFQELLAGVRDFYQLEKRYLKKNGGEIWGRLTVSILGERSEKSPFVLAMVQDITEATRAREQLEQSRRRLTMALEASRMTAWDYDPATENISWVDRESMRQVENKTEGPLAFSEVLTNVHPSDRPALLERAKRIVAEGGAFGTEFRTFAKDGSIRWMLAKGELVRSAVDGGARIVGVTVDISELKRTQLELQELAKRLMEAQEEERKRISRELHDDIGQRVALLALELDLLRQELGEQEELRERVERAQTSTAELGTDLHQLSHALHSSKLQYLGLPAALKELCTRIAEKHCLAVHVDCDAEAFVLPEEAAMALYRVAQEALNNVVRHSGAMEAHVALEVDPVEVRLSICDNGQGFEAAAKSTGIGLIGMRERVRAVRGTFQLISRPGDGTEVHARVTRPTAASLDAKVREVRTGTFR